MKKYPSAALIFIGVGMFVGSLFAIATASQRSVKSQKIRYGIAPKTITFYGRLIKVEPHFIYVIK